MNALKIDSCTLKIVWALSLIFALAACQPRSVKTTSEIDDPTSPTLALLFTEADFTGAWEWTEVGTHQKTEKPALHNQYLLETATRVLWGNYGPEKYQVILGSSVQVYSDTVRLTDLEIEKVGGERLILENAPVIEYEHAIRCGQHFGTQDFGVVFCRVIIAHAEQAFFVTLYAPTKMEKQVLAEILNEAVGVMLQRITEIDS